jgi:hypothetical protein
MGRRRLAVAGALLVAAAGCASHARAAGHRAPAPTSPSTTAAPSFVATVAEVTAAEVAASWHEGCPVPVDRLRAIDAPFWGFDGHVHQGRLVVAADQVAAVESVLHALFDARYAIHRMAPVDRYGGSDDASVRADNTSAFNCRPATGGRGWSEHAYGRAIDLNPLENPYVRGSTVLPAQSAALLDRSRTDQGIIHPGDAAVRAFAAVGWIWGGQWAGATRDYQHFSPSGR